MKFFIDHRADAPQEGRLLDNAADVLALDGQLRGVALILLQFPKWTDGRAYTQAALLRRRLRFRGEIRAVGDVRVDMAPLLARTGFDSAVLREGQDPQVAENALRFFGQAGAADTYYQGDAVQTHPLFTRSAA